MRRLATGVVAVTLTAWLAGSAAAARPKAYVGLFKDDAVAVIDTSQNRVVATVPVPKGPHGLVVTPDGSKVYVSSDGASTVSVIDTATDKIVASIDVGPNPHELAMSGDGRRVLVSAFGSSRSLVIDTATDRVAGEIAVPQVHNGAISFDGSRAYVASQKQGEAALVILDLKTMTRAGAVPLDKTPRAVDVSPDGKRVYFTLAGVNAVQVLDTTTSQIVAQIAVGVSPHQAPPTADGRWALAVAQGPGELDIVDTIANTLAAAVPVGKTPHWMAIDSDGQTAWVTNEGSNDVAVVDLVKRTVTATIAVGNAPRKIAVQPMGTPRSAAPAGATTAAPKGAKSVTIAGIVYSDHGTRDISGQRVVKLEADDYYFGPTFLRGKPGQRVRLRVENESGTLHNITIAEQQIDRDILPKKTIEVDVTVPPSGIVPFTCKFHGPLGMNGHLTIAEGKAGASREERADKRRVGQGIPRGPREPPL
jgi:YVTN family beta-propeller protein